MHEWLHPELAHTSGSKRKGGREGGLEGGMKKKEGMYVWAAIMVT